MKASAEVYFRRMADLAKYRSERGRKVHYRLFAHRWLGGDRFAIIVCWGRSVKASREQT